MHHFQYRDGVLHAEDVSLADIAGQLGTPCYVYSTATLRRHYRVFEEALSGAGLRTTICFAVKANANLSVLRILAGLGSGADVVSEGELRQALAAGIPASRIVFSGVGKTADEMAFALSNGVMQLNVESLPELEALSAVAMSLGRVAPVAARMNPDVAAGAHDKISTGRKGDKFGIAFDELRDVYRRIRELPGVEPVSLAMHIGSQLLDLQPCRRAFARMAEAAAMLRDDGVALRRLDIGGGLGIPYAPDQQAPSPVDYAAAVAETLGGVGLPLLLEPGRMIAGNAGILLSRVLYEKSAAGRRIVIVDAAMNDLLRPALYGGYHHILPVRQAAGDARQSPADFVGPVCESGDVFAKDRPAPPLTPGDAVAFMTAGAYGAVMSSGYNSRLLVPEALVHQRAFAVIRPRQTWQDLLARDRIAPWLQ